jgi:hypothetical protein
MLIESLLQRIEYFLVLALGALAVHHYYGRRALKFSKRMECSWRLWRPLKRRSGSKRGKSADRPD